MRKDAVMEKKRIPSMLLNNLLSQVDQTMGRRSLIMLLRRAGLSRYIDNLPPLNELPSIRVEQYSELLANVYELFGARSAQDIFLRDGRLSAAELRRQRPAQFALTGTALKLLSTGRQMQIVLDRLVEQTTEVYGASCNLHEEPDAFVLDIRVCPYCAEIARRSREEERPVPRPVCHIPVAMLEEMVEWATGEKHLVEEVACIAKGDPTCRFWVGR
jgi:hypothetical protein